MTPFRTMDNPIFHNRKIRKLGKSLGETQIYWNFFWEIEGIFRQIFQNQEILLFRLVFPEFFRNLFPDSPTQYNR